MAFRRNRRTLRRRPRRPRRAVMRRTRPMRMQLNTRLPNTYKFVRSSFYQAPLAAMTMDANGQYFGVMFARGLSNLYTDNAVLNMPNIAEFTSLFDQYKILRYSLDIVPRYTSWDLNTANPALPTIYWVYDQDDSTVPTAASQIMEHPKVRYRRLDKPVRITVLRPCIADEIYNTAVTTGYAPRKAPWIDLASPSIPHYGIKYFIQGAPNADYKPAFDFKATWTFLVKNPR